MDRVTLGLSFGTFVVGFLIGNLASRRGKRLTIDWRLLINSEEGTKSKEKERGNTVNDSDDEDSAGG